MEQELSNCPSADRTILSSTFPNTYSLADIFTMTSSDKIVTTVRHYCLDLFQNGFSTQKHIARGLLNGVEYLVGQEFQNINELKNELKLLGQNNLRIITSGYSKQGHLKQIELEIKKFINFIDHLTSGNLDEVEPLPYKRRLKEVNANEVRQNLKVHWDFDGGYWEPLTECCTKPFCFYPIESLDDVCFQVLRDKLSKLTNDNIFEISEERVDYEIEIIDLDPKSFETIYTDKNNKWIVYISHEGTIAFGGLDLLKQNDNIFADRKEFKNKWCT